MRNVISSISASITRLLLLQIFEMDSTSDKVRFNEADFKEIARPTTLLGRGGFGEVYGPHSWCKKTCAVKRRLFSTDDNNEKAYEACKKWMSLCHRNIIPVYNVSLEWPALYILMEYASGKSLTTVLKLRKSELPLEILKDWGSQIADGMAYLHQMNIVHRDLKSANSKFYAVLIFNFAPQVT